VTDDTIRTSPTRDGSHQPGPAEPSLADTAVAEKIKIWFMTCAIGSEGFLRPFVPKQPRWSQTIGDQIRIKLYRQQEVHPRDLQRLAYVFDEAQARLKAKIMNWKPKPQTALLSICFEEYGIVYWQCVEVSLRDGIITPGAGCA